jgi:DNA-binding beta-propeller fold protein YncE
MMSPERSRRQVLRAGLSLVGAPALGGLAGCSIEAEARTPPGGPELVWGVHGVKEGRLHRPRVVALDAEDRLYIADLTDRIQVFDREGNYLRGWRTPGLNVDGPSGLTVDPAGRVLVADTHFYRVLVYDRDGGLQGQIGDGVQGTTPGRFGYATDAVVDGAGCLYVAEYGENDRIQVFDPEGRFLRQWGGHGFEPGRFLRPRAIAFDRRGLLHVADSGNHRIQVFEPSGRLVAMWGRRGVGSGQMAYPFDLAFAPDGTLVVCEYGNSRVQRFDGEGRPLGTWGGPGREPGRLDNPCAVGVDSTGAVHVIDSGNHRVQRFRFGAATA